VHIPQSPDLSQRTIDCSGRQMATMKSSKYINSARFARTGAFWKFLDVFQLWYEIKMFGWIWPIATASGTAKWIVQRRIAFIPCKASKQSFNYFCIWKKVNLSCLIIMSDLMSIPTCDLNLFRPKLTGSSGIWKTSSSYNKHTHLCIWVQQPLTLEVANHLESRCRIL